MAPRARLLLPLLFAALVLSAVLGPGDETAHFFWNRVAARLSWPVALGALAAAGVVSFIPRAAPWALVAALGFLPYAASPQSGIDTGLYAEYALRIAREGFVDALLSWPQQVWGAADGHLHRHLPTVPASVAAALRLGLPYRAALGAWSLALVGATALLDRRAAPLLLAAPLLFANSGLLLVDVPLSAAVALGVAGALRGRWWWALPALTVKVSAGAFLLGPLACLALKPWESRRRAALTLALGALGVGAVFLLVGHHVRPFASYVSSLRSLFVQLTPWLLGAAAVGLSKAPPRERWLLLASLAGGLVVLRFAPAAHVARYALPLVPVLAGAAAFALGPRAVNAAAAFGLVLGLCCWRPLSFHHQAANLAQAIDAIPPEVDVIDVVGAYRAQSVPPDFLAPIIQVETDARVQFRGRTEPMVPGDGPRAFSWWQLHELDPWFFADDPADALLILALGGEPAPAPPGWTALGRWDQYRGSSFAFPDTVLLYIRDQATPPPP